jgi:hypothetical protein
MSDLFLENAGGIPRAGGVHLISAVTEFGVSVKPEPMTSTIPTGIETTEYRE